MLRRFLVIALLAIGATVSRAQPSLPSSFQAKTIHSPEAADIFVRWGGRGPVVVLIHGFAENSDSWAPLAADLMKDHTVVVPDLRGIGKSSKPESGYDEKTQAKDIRAVVTGLGYDKTFVVAHDIGNAVAYAYAAMYPEKVERLVVLDAPIPGIEPWNEILLDPRVWHFNFHGPDAERLVAGRERIYLDRIWNDFTGNPSEPDEITRNFFAATYAQPGGMRAGFAQFTAFSQDATDNKILEQVKLTMPVLAVGGEKSFGPLQAVIMRHVATNVREVVVAGSGHWLIQERPAETVALIRNFLDSPQPATPAVASSPANLGEKRLTPTEYKFTQRGNPGIGSATVSTTQEGNSMEAIGLLVTLEARPGKEAAAEEFLKSAQPLALNEKGTLKWYAFKIGPGKFGVFDTFTNEAGRNAHLNGDIAKALGARANELFAIAPQVEKVELLASTPLKD
jgi:pimeloyl-ACP methyl ester carboxylesterase/quinol monooxygenase YgiN